MKDARINGHENIAIILENALQSQSESQINPSFNPSFNPSSPVSTTSNTTSSSNNNNNNMISPSPRLFSPPQSPKRRFSQSGRELRVPHLSLDTDDSSRSSRCDGRTGTSSLSIVLWNALNACDHGEDGHTWRDHGFTRNVLSSILEKCGVRRNDHRIKLVMEQLPSPPVLLKPIHMEIAAAHPLILRALQGSLAIPDWPAFVSVCNASYYRSLLNVEGEVANYIPALAKADPNMFGVSICTIDGQQYSQGDTKVLFGVQSCMKPINYAIALETRGYDKVFEHIGIEPSGQAFNEMVLDRRRVDSNSGTAIPHNPLINAGAIMCCSLIEEGRDIQQKLNTVLGYWERLIGHSGPCEIDEEMYTSESASADRNRCLAYMMNEAKAFPKRQCFQKK